MKRILLLVMVVGLGWSEGFGQAPLVKQWDKRFGGDSTEVLNTFLYTKDGGYMMGGWTLSDSSGDISQPLRGEYDFWVVKTDASGNKKWEKRYGGVKRDILTSILETNDGGYLLGGYSKSGIGWDKSQPNLDSSSNTSDYWIIKIDSIGNKLWDKSYGGDKSDELTRMLRTYDGGYLLGGNTWYKSTGDISEYQKGFRDIWVIKIDSVGVKQWNRRLGGNYFTALTAMQPTYDAGYILGAELFSSKGGDASEEERGYTDYWVLKLDFEGRMEWERRFGGAAEDYLSQILPTEDGYLLGGSSASGVSWDKTVANIDTCWNPLDFWIVKIDFWGNKQWDKSFGGLDNDDEIATLSYARDSGYLIAGTSYSMGNGSKSEDNLGLEQAWIVKIDVSGNIIWDKTILTDGHDEGGYLVLTPDGGYVIATSTNSGIAGYQTQKSRGRLDFWLIKFIDTLNDCNLNVSIIKDGNTLSSFGASSYQWYLNGSKINGATQAVYIANEPGSYAVEITDGNGCTALSTPIFITGVNEIESEAVSIYPNPSAMNNLQITMTNSLVGSNMEVYDTNGKMVFQTTINQQQTTLSPALSAGVYFIRIHSERVSIVKKWVRL
ncbi:MAG: T9SS type A sorting domain-containing protein [Bacteroidetes bacterium]|nr:T9SS type A sorting domain-containing protein [Bacteroidota bacterium]